MIPQNFLKAIASEHRVSSRELDVLSLAMKGESVMTISQNLHISEDAVRKRLSEVYHKFQIVGRGPVKLTKLQQHLIGKYQERANLQAIFADVGNVSSQPSIDRGKDKIQNPIDWDNAPDVTAFYGRNQELATLNEWVVDRRCRLIALLGIGGIGKTALGVKLARQIQEQFDCLVWRSLASAPTLKELLNDLIDLLHPQPETLQSQKLERQISWLIGHFQSSRCLIILDRVESIFSSGELVGTYCQGYENYGQFFRRLGEEASKSCVLITSREKIKEISLLEGANSPVRSLKLQSLDENAKLLLTDKELSGQQDWDSLIERYRGNPMMLKLAATTIQEVFDGDVSDFMATSLFPRNVKDFVKETIDRISELELKIILQIVGKQEPVFLPELISSLADFPIQDVVGAVVSLRQRSLLEKSMHGFVIPPVVEEILSFSKK